MKQGDYPGALKNNCAACIKYTAPNAVTIQRVYLRKFTSDSRSKIRPPNTAPSIASGAATAKNHHGGKPVACVLANSGKP